MGHDPVVAFVEGLEIIKNFVRLNVFVNYMALH